MTCRFNSFSKLGCWVCLGSCLAVMTDALAGHAQTSAGQFSSNRALVMSLPSEEAISSSTLALPRRAQRAYGDAEAALRKGEYEKAKEFDEKALRIAPNFPDALTLRGYLRMKAGEFDAARGDLSRSIELAPNSSLPFLWRGLVEMDLDEVEQALPDLKMYWAVHTQSWLCAYAIATALLVKRENAEALKYVDLALAMGASDPGIHIARANALIGLRRYDEAAIEFRDYLKAAPDGPLAEAADQTIRQIRSRTSQQEVRTDREQRATR